MSKKIFSFLFYGFLIFGLFVPNFSRIHDGFAIGISATEKIDINTTSLEQLDELAGIGPVYAQRIIDGRPYSSVDDLLEVKGIGPATLQKIKDQGLACVNCQTTIESPNTEIQNTLMSEPTPAIVYPGEIIINEIMPNPEGADETEEWVELYNQNNFEVDLSNWLLEDREGSATTYTIPKDTKISANGFLIFKRPDTKIMLNNDSDGLNFSNPNKDISDSVSFSSAPLGQSYNKIGPDRQWSATSTPGKANRIRAPLANPGTDSLPKAKNSDKNNPVEPKELAAGLNPAGNEVFNGANPWILFFIVLSTAIVSAFVLLIIKLRLKGVKNLTPKT